MDNVLAVITLIFFLAAIVSLFKPRFILKNSVSRKKPFLIFIGLSVLFFILTGVVSPKLTENDTTPKESVVTLTPSPAPSTPASIEETVAPRKEISYEIVKQWEIPNEGYGKVIVIPPDYLNEEDMATLGNKLKDDTKNDRNAFIFVYTDKKAANLRDRIFDENLPESEREFYDTHFVANYKKNANSGFHEFTIYFDGVMGSNQKTISFN